MYQKAGEPEPLPGSFFYPPMNEPDSIKLRSQEIDREWPASPESEVVFLGAIILEPELISVAVDLLKPPDMYVPSHRHIYGAMISLFEQWLDITPIRIAEELKQQGHLGISTSFITNLTFGLPYSVDLADYARLIKDKSRLRQLIKANEKSTAAAFAQEDLPEVIIERSEKAIFDISSEHTETGFVSAREVAFANVETAHRLHDQGVTITGVPSGYTDLDAKTLGWQKGDLIIVAARPSMGKTQFVINLALNAAIRDNYRVGIFSLEMSKEALVNRMLASEGRIDSQRVRNGLLTPQEFDIIHSARDATNERIQINEMPGITSLGVRAKIMRLISDEGPVDLGIVDFLQLMDSTQAIQVKRNINREQEVSAMTRELKATAMQLNIPLVVVASLNRGPEQRSDRRPQLADLRESGNIEYAADVVAMIYREDYYRSKAEHEYVPTNTAEIILAKQRNGPTGIINLRFDAASGRFDNIYQA